MTAMTEEEEQRTLFEWAAMMEGRMPELKLLFHVPNEGKRTAVSGGRMKAAGMKKGVPDLWMPVARAQHHGLVIELKRANGGKTTPEQDGWIAALNEQGYRAMVCHGWDEARAAICAYLREGV